MKSIHIRNIDSNIVDSLKRLATMHHRSLQGELRSILAQAAHMAPPEETEEAFSLNTVKTKSTGTWTREELYGDQGR